MAKKKKAIYNPALKSFFEEEKKTQGVTSKDIAAALGVSQQSVSDMSGKLDSISVKDMVVMAETLRVVPALFMEQIMRLSDCKTNFVK